MKHAQYDNSKSRKMTSQIYDRILYSGQKNFINIPPKLNDHDEYFSILRENIASEAICAIENVSSEFGKSEYPDETYECYKIKGLYTIKDIPNNLILRCCVIKIKDRYHIITQDYNRIHTIEIQKRDAMINIYPKFDEGSFKIKLIVNIRDRALEYDSINIVEQTCKSSIITSLLDPSIVASGHYTNNNIELIKCNDSQLQTINALYSNLECIHGPAGTGKSTTIINIINKRIPENHAILCTAVQNQAIDALVEKLQHTYDKLPFVVFGNPNDLGDTARKYIPDLLYVKNGELKKKMNSLNNWKKLLDLLMSKKENEWPRILAKNYLTKIANKPSEQIIEHIKEKINDLRDMVYEQQNESLKTVKIFLSTIASIQKIRIKIFDTVIIDEASTVTEMTLPIVLRYNPTNIILIGDHKQLEGFTCNSDNNGKTKHNISFLERALSNGRNYNMLTVQYRMCYEICKMVSKTFYDGKLISYQKKTDQNDNFPLKWYYVGGIEKKEDTSYYNMEEIEYIKLLCNNEQSITILSPYNKQIEKLKKHIHMKNVKIKSIDSAQGTEDDIIIISMVRSNDKNNIGFINNPRRSCVMLSRAKKEIWIVGNNLTFVKHQMWSNVMSYFEIYNKSKGEIMNLKNNFVDVKNQKNQKNQNDNITNNKMNDHCDVKIYKKYDIDDFF